MDLVEGKKGQNDPYLLVLTERASRKEIIELIPDKTSDSVIKGLDRIERRMGPVVFRNSFKSKHMITEVNLKIMTVSRHLLQEVQFQEQNNISVMHIVLGKEGVMKI